MANRLNVANIGYNDATDALTIDSSGNVTAAGTLSAGTISEAVADAGVTIDGLTLKDGGIQFRTATGGSGTFDSGTLDDYEEGTFDLVGKDAGGTTLFTSSNQPYQKIGNRCFVEIYFVNSSGTNATRLDGLPFIASGAHWAPQSFNTSYVVYIPDGYSAILWNTASNVGATVRMQISYQTI